MNFATPGSGTEQEDERVDGEGESPASSEREDPEYADAILAAQPFRGYELSAILAGDDRRAVFKSHDTTLDRPVAVKVMRPWKGRPGVVEDFFSLAGSIARLKCPGVARGFDAGRGDGDFFLVYEFLPGESLEHKLSRRQSGRLTEKEALKLVVEILGILQNLFDRGSPHGNLKPSNIIIADGGIPRLADIGFAWELAWPDDDAAFAAHPDYLPPERLAGDFNIDVRGDLYSLGAIWFRALTGRPVFQGETPEETVRLHREQKAPDAASVDPKISVETAELIRWLLEKNRDDRPRTPRALLKKLARHPLVADIGDTGDEDDDGDDDGAEDGEEPQDQGVEIIDEEVHEEVSEEVSEDVIEEAKAENRHAPEDAGAAATLPEHFPRE